MILSEELVDQVTDGMKLVYREYRDTRRRLVLARHAAGMLKRNYKTASPELMKRLVDDLVRTLEEPLPEVEKG